MFEKIKNIFRKKNSMELKINMLHQSSITTNEHLIAIARLLFIKPENLYRESRNIKANADYAMKLIEIMQKKGEADENKGDNLQSKKRTA